MKRRLSVLAPALFAGGLLLSASARAADPTTADCLAASEASFKSGNDHKLRAERAQLLICASPNCPADIRKECARRVDEVNAAIPTIIFEAKGASGADLSAVKVTMDGEVLAERLEGSALSIDPGEHTFVFETAGQPSLTKQFVIGEAQKERREAISFGLRQRHWPRQNRRATSRSSPRRQLVNRVMPSARKGFWPSLPPAWEWSDWGSAAPSDSSPARRRATRKPSAPTNAPPRRVSTPGAMPSPPETSRLRCSLWGESL